MHGIQQFHHNQWNGPLSERPILMWIFYMTNDCYNEEPFGLNGRWTWTDNIINVHPNWTSVKTVKFLSFSVGKNSNTKTFSDCCWDVCAICLIFMCTKAYGPKGLGEGTRVCYYNFASKYKRLMHTATNTV